MSCHDVSCDITSCHVSSLVSVVNQSCVLQQVKTTQPWAHGHEVLFRSLAGVPPFSSTKDSLSRIPIHAPILPESFGYNWTVRCTRTVRGWHVVVLAARPVRTAAPPPVPDLAHEVVVHLPELPLHPSFAHSSARLTRRVMSYITSNAIRNSSMPFLAWPPAYVTPSARCARPFTHLK